MLYLMFQLSHDPHIGYPERTFLQIDQASRQVQEKHSDQPYTFIPPEQEQDYLLYILFIINKNKEKSRFYAGFQPTR